MSETLKQLNMRVPEAVHEKLEELAKTLSINKTAALVMAINEYYKQVCKPV